MSIWRNWRQTDTSRLAGIHARPAPDGIPLKVERVDPNALSVKTEVALHLFKSGSGYATERVGLVLPTSMCAAQIARMAADRMNQRGLASELGLSRFVALAHS